SPILPIKAASWVRTNDIDFSSWRAILSPRGLYIPPTIINYRVLGQYHNIFSIMIWVAPGVFIGGQIGPAIARRLPLLYMKVYVGVLLIFVSILMFIRAFALF
ncbi:MAG TPA: hypothetical protein VMW40_04340, partial [Candidatus Bathyarchaeia archaeon]|nr:hypothetical protein [Candidatus Bathyarchaeia archaeon]